MGLLPLLCRNDGVREEESDILVLQVPLEDGLLHRQKLEDALLHAAKVAPLGNGDGGVLSSGGTPASHCGQWRAAKKTQCSHSSKRVTSARGCWHSGYRAWRRNGSSPCRQQRLPLHLTRHH